VRLVEAVKLVDTTGVSSDGRIRPKGRGKQRPADEVSNGEPLGSELLKHAKRTQDGYYVVESPPKARSRK
jgi:hypothetical protein